MMTRLKDFPWWPTVWDSETGVSPAPEEISADGILKNARPMNSGLKLFVDYRGNVFTGVIEWPASLSGDSLIFLRHILLQHWGEPMVVIENIEIASSGNFLVTK